MPRQKKEGNVAENSKAIDYGKLQEKVIENLVELQKVHTSLAERFDKLSDQITGLLTLFETAARSFADHPANIGIEKDKEFLDKIDKLLEQNKTIAKGLTLMEERARERVYGLPVNSQSNDQNNNSISQEYEYPSLNKVDSANARQLPKF